MKDKIDPNFKYFDSQQADEKVIMVIRRHIISLFDSFAIVTFMYLIGFFTIVILPVIMPNVLEGFAYNIYVLAISLIFLYSTTFLFSAWVMHYLTICILTNEHFVEIEQNGLFAREISTLSLDKVQDTTASQAGLIHTLLNLGTVLVQTAGERENFKIPFVPDPNRVSQKIMEVEEEFAKNNGLRTDGQHFSANIGASKQSVSETEQILSEPSIEYGTDVESLPKE